MKIAIIADKLSLPIDEGLKKLTFNMMEYAIKRSNVDVYSSPAEIGLKGICVYKSNKLMVNTQIYSILQNNKYTDIYYIPEASATFFSLIRAWMLYVQSSCHAKVHLVCGQKREITAYQKRLSRLLSGVDVIAFSKVAAREIESCGLRVKEYPLGVDVDVFKPVDDTEKRSLRERYGIDNDVRVALHVGHVRKSRNVTSLVRLARAGWTVIVIGSTSMAYEKNIADELRMEGIRVWGDYIMHVEELYQLSDLYVFPVKEDTAAIDFPLSVMEAMACGLPIITTRHGALPEHFNESPCFRYFDSDSEMVKLADEAIMYSGAANRKLVVSKYSWDHVFNQILQ